MATGELLKRLALFLGVAGVLLGLLLLFGGGPEEPRSGGLFAGPIPPPPKVRLPRELAAELARGREQGPVTALVLHRAAGGFEAARTRFDLVVGGRGKETPCGFGSRWPARVEPGSGRLHLGWIGPLEPRLRAILVRTLEVVLPLLALPRTAVRTHAEVGPTLPCPGSAPESCLGSPLSGSVIRAWIRGAGAGQEARGR